MRLNKTERESLRKRVEIVIPQMKKSEIIVYIMASQSKTKRKLAAQLPGHLLERIS